MKNKFKPRQIIILYFIMGLMASCSTNNVVSQLMELKNIDFDKVNELRQYVTLDKDEAREWCDKERKNGYAVYERFNSETGEHICKSIPKDKISLPREDKLLDLLGENGEFLLEDED